MDNQQVLIDSLPRGKLSADIYRLAVTDAPTPADGEVTGEPAPEGAEPAPEG